ncbi:MAG TPA: helix-turn-helix domain-containing protein, partial [Telluria sp.]|nr:helix-turn-helix domain-containing protein [Telluria sp.]
VFHVDAPPLRDRVDDLPGLVRFLLDKGARRMNLDQQLSVDSQAMQVLCAYSWPGNVRELENVVDRALILAEGGVVTCADLPAQLLKGAAAALPPAAAAAAVGGDTLREQVRRFESNLIARVIEEADGDRRVAAQRLGIGLSSLYRKLEEFESLGLQDTGRRSEPR